MNSHWCLVDYIACAIIASFFGALLCCAGAEIYHFLSGRGSDHPAWHDASMAMTSTARTPHSVAMAATMLRMLHDKNEADSNKGPK